MALEIQVGKAYETRSGARALVTALAEGKGSSPFRGSIFDRGVEMTDEYWTRRGKHRNQTENNDYDIVREEGSGSE